LILTELINNRLLPRPNPFDFLCIYMARRCRYLYYIMHIYRQNRALALRGKTNVLSTATELYYYYYYYYYYVHISNSGHLKYIAKLRQLSVGIYTSYSTIRARVFQLTTMYNIILYNVSQMMNIPSFLRHKITTWIRRWFFNIKPLGTCLNLTRRLKHDDKPFRYFFALFYRDTFPTKVTIYYEQYYKL